MAPFEMPFSKTKGQNLFDANKNDTLFTLCMGSDLVHLTHIKVFCNLILPSLSLAKKKKNEK